MLTDVLHIMADISWTADIFATIVAIVIGVIWYHPRVLGTLWLQLATCKMEDPKSVKARNGALWNIPLLFIIAANVAAFCKYFEFDSPQKAVLIGYDLGLIVCLFMAINYLREQRPFILFCVNAGYVLLAMSMMGMVIGMVL